MPTIAGMRTVINPGQAQSGSFPEPAATPVEFSFRFPKSSRKTGAGSLAFFVRHIQTARHRRTNESTNVDRARRCFHATVPGELRYVRVFRICGFPLAQVNRSATRSCAGRDGPAERFRAQSLVDLNQDHLIARHRWNASFQRKAIVWRTAVHDDTLSEHGVLAVCRACGDTQQRRDAHNPNGFLLCWHVRTHAAAASCFTVSSR